jgi:hypothetical protein
VDAAKSLRFRTGWDPLAARGLAAVLAQASPAGIDEFALIGGRLSQGAQP